MGMRRFLASLLSLPL